MLSCLALHHLRLGYGEFSRLRYGDEGEFYARFPGAVLLQTGTRVEVYTLREPEEVLAELSRRSGVEQGRLEECFRRFSGGEAAEHLLRMACMLESKVMGESYILWQVEAAAEHATGLLGELFTRAVSAGREAEALLATRLHLEVHGRLREMGEWRRVTLYGAGRTGRELARILASEGSKVTVAHRCRDIAERCASEVGGSSTTRVAEACRQAELLICATLASHVRLKPEMVGEDSTVVDLSPFANVSPEVGKVARVLDFRAEMERRMQEMRALRGRLEELVRRELEALPPELRE